jgi:hypothetical protein
MWGASVKAYGMPKSATRAYLMNFLPGLAPKAKSLSSVLAVRGGSDGVYAANSGLDLGGKGTITVGDLAAMVDRAAKNPIVAEAIASTYALRPGASPDGNPAYGTDYLLHRLAGQALPIGAVLLAVGLIAHRPLAALARSAWERIRT